MGAHQIRRWIDSFLNRVGSKRRAQRPTFRPRLEALEDRTLMNAGALDPTFGVGGVVVDHSNSNYSNQWVLGFQPDGKLLEVSGGSKGLNLLRTNADGSLDQTFVGSAGGPYAVTGFFIASSVVVQSDGKILVAGEDDIGGYFNSGNFLVARFNADGSLDNSFGVGGMVVTKIGLSDYVAGMVLQADGKIVLGGTADNQFALARYNANGSLDATFGNAGTVVTPGTVWGSNANGIALQSDGKIIMAGRFVASISTADVGVIRYNSDGTLDATFGQAGIVDTPFAGQNSQAASVAVQANGDILVLGDADADGQHFHPALVRYTSNGSLDATFGNGGEVVTNVPKDPFQPERMALQADGKILVATMTFAPRTSAIEFVLARYNGDGGIDASFGVGGQIVTIFDQYSFFQTDMALQPDGKIVVAGYSLSGPVTDPGNPGKIEPRLTLARFQNDSLPLVLPKPPPAKTSTPTNGPSASSDTPAPSTPPAVIVPSTPPQVVPNILLFTQGSAAQEQSAVIPQSPVLLVVSPPAATSAVVASGPSNADPFGIHLVGGSDPGDLDTTARWDDFPVFAPDYPICDAATGLAALPLTPTEEAGVSLSVVMDALFLQMPLWRRFQSAPVKAVELSATPLGDFPVEGNSNPPLVKTEGVGRWPTLAVGVLMSTGMTAAAVEERRRRRLASHFGEPGA